MEAHKPIDAEINTEKVVGKLLNQVQRENLEHIAAGEAPFSQRAQALLALDEGLTQAEAGQQAGLTSGQVKYWLGKFRKEGMEIFPEVLLKEAEPRKELTEEVTKSAGEPESKTKKSEAEDKIKSKDKPKKKKAKKSKKPKKSKKTKKTKSKKVKSGTKSKKK